MAERSNKGKKYGRNRFRMFNMTKQFLRFPSLALIMRRLRTETA
ncbi:hypothetical protein NBRC3255_1839 [Gluconobacter thailandicus NBRC 3255]|nr:hypothetical protein NBRC3255_1839 [Gluconobacter thailandicus NBRC 3255]